MLRREKSAMHPSGWFLVGRKECNLPFWCSIMSRNEWLNENRKLLSCLQLTTTHFLISTLFQGRVLRYIFSFSFVFKGNIAKGKPFQYESGISNIERICFISKCQVALFHAYCDFVMGADKTKNRGISEFYSDKKIDDNVQGSCCMPEESMSWNQSGVTTLRVSDVW